MSGNLHTIVRDLHRRKARERRGLLLAEGHRAVAEAFAANAAVEGLVIAEDAADAAQDLRRLAAGRGVPVELTPRRDFDALADTATPSGVLAVVAWEPATLATLGMPPDDARPVLVLDAVQDPGNVGTMIRTAFALGAWATVALDGTADVRNPKVVRGAMGALFRHPVALARFDEAAAWLAGAGCTVLVAAMDGTPVGGDRIPRPALVVGSEGHGVREGWDAHPVRRVGVAMESGAESLNAAVAAGILLHALRPA